MGAVVLSLEVHRDRRAWDAFRGQAHEDLDALLDRLEGSEMEAGSSKPSLYAMSKAVREARPEFTGALVAAYVERRYAELLHQDVASCPRCGRLRKARPARKRTVETMVGPVTVERPYFYCEACRHGFYPLDEALGLTSGIKQLDVLEAAMDLDLEMPYERASELFNKHTDASMSDCAMHTMVQEIGEGTSVLDVCPSHEEIQRRIAAVAEGRKWKPIVVLAIDGAAVPTRPETAKGTRPGRRKVRARRKQWKGEYRQAKGFRFFLVDDDRIVHLISWHRVQNDEEMGAALREIRDAGLIPEDQVRLCAVADGAPWIWRWVEELFPTARQILDFYHCSSYLHAVAEAQYGPDALKATQWLEATMARLFCDEGAGEVWGLQRMKPTSSEAEEAISKALSYLTPRLEQIHYGSHRKGGYPIGSGGIESANRFIGHVRLKRPGAWWYQENSNAILALRCALYNGTLSRLLQQRLHELTYRSPCGTPQA